MANWQDIATAPKDGTRILVRHKSGALTLGEVQGRPFMSTTDWYLFSVAFRCSAQNVLSDFTHWMPLPEPPA